MKSEKHLKLILILALVVAVPCTVMIYPGLASNASRSANFSLVSSYTDESKALSANLQRGEAQATTLTIRNNNVEENNAFGLWSSVYQVAEENWWGHPSGPHHPVLNPNGQGNKVSDNVDFDPWHTQRIPFPFEVSAPLPTHGDVVVCYSNIQENANYGVFGTMPVLARKNWWGDAGGPYHPLLNPYGRGNPVSDNVDFASWLTSPVDIYAPPQVVSQTPALLSPSNRTVIGSRTLSFDWSDISDPWMYHIQVDDSDNFAQPEIDKQISESRYISDTPLANGTYYWRVRAKSPCAQWSNWSQVWSFTVLMGTTPVSQGSVALLVSRVYITGQPIVASVRVSNLTATTETYTLILSLIRAGVVVDTRSQDVAVPGGESVVLSGFSFGTRPAGSYELQAELRLSSVLLSTQTASIAVFDFDAQRLAEDYAGKLKLAARDEFDQMAGIPAQIVAQDIVNWGWDKIESLFGQYFQEAAAPAKEADPVGASDANISRGLQEGQALLEQIGEKIRLYIAARLRQIIYERTGVLLPEWFDPLNPEASLRDLTAEVKDMIKEIIAEEVTGIVKEYFLKALFTNPQMRRIEMRHSQFDTYMANLLPTWSWTPDLEQTFDRGRDAIQNTVESDPIVTLGPITVLGKTLRYDVTLLEQQHKYEEIEGLQGLLGKIILAFTVIGVVIAVLIFIGAVATTGPFATAILPLVWKIVAFLTKVKEVLLPLGLTFLTVTMIVSVPILAPRITTKHDNTLDEVEAIIGSKGQALILKEVAIAPTPSGEPVHVRAIVESQEEARPAAPVVETVIYSIDGRAVQVLWAQPTLKPHQSAHLDKEILLPPGSYWAVSTIHTGERTAIAVQSQPFTVSAPELQLALALNKTVFTLGEAVRATISITNTSLNSNVNNLTLIVESSDGQNFNGWPISLGPGEARRVDYTFVSPAEGGYVLRATVAAGLNELAVQDVAYVVGTGASLALNINSKNIYDPGAIVSLPITATNVGELPTSTVLSLVTLDRLRNLTTVYTNTLPINVAPGASVAIIATALPADLARPGLYTARLFLGSNFYTSLDFAVAAEDTLFADIYPNTVFPSVGDTVALTVQIMNSAYVYTDALVNVSILRPDGVTRTVTMNAIGTGRYVGTVTVPITGTYLASVEVSKPNYRAVGNSTFFVAGERSQLLPTVDGRPILGTTRPVTVTVRNEQGTPIVGASLMVSGTLEYLSRQTDKAGQAVLYLSPTITEPYRISLEKPGFATTLMDLPVWIAPDVTPPPLFLDIPSITNRTPLIVMGLTEAGASVKVNSQAVVADAQGRFTTTVALNEGNNLLEANATDGAGNTTTVTRTVTLDTVPPALTVTYPPAGLITTREVITVTGTTEVGTKVVISGTLATVDPISGDFRAWALLRPGLNSVPIVAEDRAGNITTITVAVTYSTAPCYDFDASGAVDSGDLQLIAARWRQRVGDPGWDARFDLDGDGDVDVADIMRVSRAVGKRCP